MPKKRHIFTNSLLVLLLLGLIAIPIGAMVFLNVSPKGDVLSSQVINVPDTKPKVKETTVQPEPSITEEEFEQMIEDFAENYEDSEETTETVEVE